MKHHFPGLKKDHTAAGTLRWRVRQEGSVNKLIKIPMGPGEPGFHEHYAAARRGEKLVTVKPVKPKRGTLDELCDRYIEAMKVQVAAGNLSALTLSGRTTGLRHACEVKDLDGDRMGSLDADLPRPAFLHIWDSFGTRTGAAETCLKALRAAYKWGQDRGFPANSAVFSVKSKHRGKGGAVPWEAEDVAKFLTCHGPGTKARLWFCLAYATHSRISDVRVLGPKHEVMHDNRLCIEWQPKKKGSAFVSLPLDEMLLIELQNHTVGETYLQTEKGMPFASTNSLDKQIRRWIVQAGLAVNDKPTRSQHGIRKGVAKLMAESGATEYEIMSAFGWTEPKTAAVYTKDFRRRTAANSAKARIAADGVQQSGGEGSRNG